MTQTDEKLLAGLNKYDVHLPTRTIFIMGDLTDKLTHRIAKGLYLLNDSDTKLPIKLIISSSGGSIFNMFHLYDLISSSKSPVHTSGYGTVSSAAVPLLCAGKKGFRTGSKNLHVVIHQISEGPTEEPRFVNELVTSSKTAALQQKAMFSLLASHTKHSAKWYEDNTARNAEVHFTGKSIVTSGIVDRIV